VASESQVAPGSLGHNPFLDVCCFCFVIVSYVDEMLVKWLDFSVNFYASAHSVDGTRSIVFSGCLSIYACIYLCAWAEEFPTGLLSASSLFWVLMLVAV